MIKNFIKDGLIYTLPTVISRGLNIFLLPLYTRILSTEDYGAWDMLLLFMNIIQLTIALEISQAVARFYFEESDIGKITTASTALWFTLFTNLLFFFIAQLFAEHLAILLMGSIKYLTVLRVGLGYIFVNSIFYLIQNQFRWELKSINYSIVSIIFSVITTIFAFILGYYLEWGLKGIIMGTIIGSVTASTYGFIKLKTTFKFTFSTSKLKTMLRFSSPLVFSGIAVFLSHYIDRLMIRHFLTLSDLGIYSLAFRFSSVVGIVMMGFVTALTPLVYKHYKDTNTPKEIAKIFRYFMFFGLVMFIGLSIFSKEAMLIFTTSEFYPAGDLFVFLVPSIILTNMYVFAPGISIKKKTGYILLINLIGAVLQIVFNYFLIPVYSYMGAAIATLLGNFCIFIMYMLIGQKLYYIPIDYIKYIMGILISILLILVVKNIEVNIFIGVLLKLVIIIIAFLLFYMIKIINRDDVNLIRSKIIKQKK